MQTAARQERSAPRALKSRVAAAVVASLGAMAFLAAPASAATSTIPLSEIPAPTPGNPSSGTLPNGVTYTVDKGKYIPHVNAPGWVFNRFIGSVTWTFSEPVDVRFGIRNVQVTGECVQFSEGVVAESIDTTYHSWNPEARTLCSVGGTIADALLATSTFTVANTTSLVIQSAGSGFFTSAISFIEVSTLVPKSNADCQNGGWATFNGKFKNQGECIAFVNTGGTNPPSGPNA